MSNCLVTGGCGFIGRHLVNTLVRLGHEVSVIDWNRDGFAKLPVPSQNCHALDIATINSLSYMTCEFGKKFDVLFHLAAVSRTVPAIDDPVRCMLTNVVGTAKMLELARQAGIPRVVVSSSNVVYAGQTPYRDSKRAVEDMCGTYAALYDRSVIGMRYSNVYGSNIPTGDPAVFAMLRDSYELHGYASVTGDGEQTRDFTHVSDIVAGNVMAWASEFRGVIDLCTGVQTSINRACEMLRIPVKYTADRPGDCKAMIQDSEPAWKVLGWRASVKLEEGIQDIWNA